MESDPISSSPPHFTKRQWTTDEHVENDRFSPVSEDEVSSPPAASTYITQPTQLLPTTTTEIAVLATSPSRPLPARPAQTTQQNSIFLRMAPPGTYLNVPKPVLSQPQTQTQLLKPQLDSDNEDGFTNLISDSEDELNASDPSNIPPAPIVTALSRFKYQDPQSKTSTNPAPLHRSISTINKPDASSDWLMDVKVKNIQVVYPHLSWIEIITRLRQKHWNEQDTMDSFAADMEEPTTKASNSDDDLDLLSPIQPKNSNFSRVKPPKLLNKHTIENKKSLAQKYNQPGEKRQLDHSQPTQKFDSLQTESPPKAKRRRLIRGSERSISRDVSPAIVVNVQKKKKIILEEDLSDSGSDADEQEVPLESNNESLLAFFNTCKVGELVDLANTSEDTANLIVSKRPFTNLNQIRKIEDKDTKATKGRGRGGSKRTIGERVLDVSEQMWEGLMAIDRLLESCQEVGLTVKNGMEQLNLSTNGSEIEAVELSSSRADSGVGSPSPSVGNATRLEQPSIMAADFKLKDYQVVALNWLNLMYSNSISPILADEMGLGKTACVIAFISYLWEQGKKGPHLIVVPGSTLENWIREFKRFSPQIDVYAYHGSQAERRGMREEVIDNPPEVLVTTYEMCQSKDDNKLFRRIRPITTVYDEGHMLKNKNSKRYTELMKIPSPWRLLLTGTPLQNNLQELVSILGFIMPEMFCDIDEHLSYIFKHRAKTTDEEHTALLSAQRVNRARKMMAPFILRRRKEQVLKSMPKKTSRIEYCDMTPRQKGVYDDYTAIHEEALQSREAGQVTELRNHLMERRKAAIHPLLFRYIYDNDVIDKIHRKIPTTGKFRGWSRIKMLEEMSWWSDFKIHQTCLEYPELNKHSLDNDEWMDSGKVAKLVELVKKFSDEGGRTLVFSQFTMVLDILESVFETEGIKFCRLDGSTSIAQRQEYIDEFHTNESLQVFMLSTKSGGTGINLACANKVIIFDSSFNPHDDIQAENRAHRVGQTREVEVVRLVTRGSIEEQIYRLGRSKLALDQLVSGIDEKVADEKGMALVERMLLGGSSNDVSGVPSEDDVKMKKELSQNRKVVKRNGEGQDVKDAFLNGLKAAGLNVQA
jgi:SWI/SNF-related matrix-associated actin-dependent regulator of chromatin subfamily A containing DEAD/H box 1